MMNRVINYGLFLDLVERIVLVKMVFRRILVVDLFFIWLDFVIGLGFKEIYSNLKVLNKILKIL